MFERFVSTYNIVHFWKFVSVVFEYFFKEVIIDFHLFLFSFNPKVQLLKVFQSLFLFCYLG
jgi:hypothetical protein